MIAFLERGNLWPWNVTGLAELKAESDPTNMDQISMFEVDTSG